jgi:hypothetical protein
VLLIDEKSSHNMAVRKADISKIDEIESKERKMIDHAGNFPGFNGEASRSATTGSKGKYDQEGRATPRDIDVNKPTAGARLPITAPSDAACEHYALRP